MFKMFSILLIAGAMPSLLTAQQLRWRDMAKLPRPVAGYMGGVVNGKLLIIGGSYWENKTKQWTDLVQVFDPRSNTWRKGPSLPGQRSDAAFAAIGNDIYVFGGSNGTEVRKDAILLHRGKWRRLPAGDLPDLRLYAVAIASGESIYVLGGLSKAGDYESVASTFWRWNPMQKGWDTLPPLPGPGRIGHAMAEINGRIYVFGGATTGPKDVRNLNDAYCFDPANSKWTRLSDLPVPVRALWAVGLGNHALLLGGYTDVFERRVYLYDPEHDLQRADDLPHALADIKFFRLGEMLVGAGGEAADRVRGSWTMGADVPKLTPRKKSED